MKLPLRGVAVYNPALLSKDELLAQFVARKALLETILSELRGQDRPDHRILLGPRGMGKTTLLRRIAFAVEEEAVLSRRWIALPFPEEQYNLTRLSDFYLNCVDALGDALVHLGRQAEAEALDARRDSLPEGDEEEREEAACSLLLSMADELGRKLLLLVDNVEMVLDRLTSSQWKLRELLGHDPRLCLLGASAFAPESTYTYRSAFYEFFRFHELRPLQEDEAREVLLHLARVRGAPDIERVVNGEPARVRTLFALAGGNPRTLVQLYAVLAQSTEGDARSDLERLLDECTPIYKARFEALSLQAQQIMDAAALHWHPASAADLAAATRLDINVVSSQVSRLLKEGVLEAVQAAEGPRKAYQVSERFFNIWYLMRASRRQRQRLVWLVELLRVLHGQDELPGHARKRLGQIGPGDIGALSREAEYRMALAQAVEDRSLRRALVSSAVRAWAQVDGLDGRMAELIELAPGDAQARTIADRHKAMADLRKKILRAKVKKKGWDAARFWELLGGSQGSLEQKQAVAAQLEKASAKKLDGWISELETQDQEIRKAIRCEKAVEALRHAICDGDMDDLGDVEGGESAALTLECPELRTLVLSSQARQMASPDADTLQRLEDALRETPGMAWGWLALGHARAKCGSHQAAETALRTGLEADPEHAAGWLRLAITLFLNPDNQRSTEAEAAARKASILDPNDADAWHWLGRVRFANVGHDAETEYACRRAVELNPANPWNWINLGDYLCAEKPEEAEAACRKALELAPDMALGWYSLGEVLEASGRYKDAADAFQRATAQKEPFAWAWVSLGRILEERLDQPDEAEAAYRAAMSIEKTRRSALFEKTRRSALLKLTRLRFRRDRVDAETEQFARDLLQTESSAPNKLLLAMVLLRRSLRDEPIQLARAAFTETAPEQLEAIWGLVLDFFTEVIHAWDAAQALQLLGDLGLAERWLPLHAALTAARDGKRALLGFAPEVRRPAEALLARFEESSVRTTPVVTTLPGKPSKSTRARKKPDKRSAPVKTARRSPKVSGNKKK